jgi:hypothetical protein
MSVPSRSTHSGGITVHTFAATEARSVICSAGPIWPVGESTFAYLIEASYPWVNQTAFETEVSA